MEETFWTLLRDPAHWEFELFLMLVFDGLVGAVLWPRLARWRSHHTSADRKIAALERKVLILQVRIAARAARCRCARSRRTGARR